jgi:HAE1 family hydrophobic/amphiphilic exporter-1
MNLPQLAIARPVFISMVTLMLVVLGVLALTRLPVDLYPDITYPVLAVRTSYDGAGPEEIESLISVPIEDVLSTVADVKTIRSISREGNSFVILEFNQGTDIKYQETQVRAKVGNILNRLPEAAGIPVVSRQDPDDAPIIELVLQGNRPASELTELADDVIGRRLRQVAGVGEVTFSGATKREIHVDLRPVDLATYGISGSAVVAALAQNNRNDPVGRVEGSDRRWLVRLTSKITSLADMGTIAVGETPSGKTVLLSQVATLSEGFAERDSLSRYGDKNGLNPAVTIEVTKQSGENTVAISNRIQEAIEDLRSVMPEDVTITLAQDNADLIRTNVADVTESLVVAVALTIMVVLLFLRSPRSTLTTGLAIPSSIITTFAAMALAGFSMNVMTLLALSLSIGLVVDDAIVVRENIFRHLTKDPAENPTAEGEDLNALNRVKRGIKAALEGTQEVTLAVVATTATVIAVFLPVGFMDGVTGQFFKPFALTVVFAMIVSLWDALTMAPMLSAYMANVPNPASEWLKFGRLGAAINSGLLAFEHSFDRLGTAYAKGLGVLTSKGWIAGCIAAVSLIGGFVGFKYIDKSFLPPQLGATFTVFLDGPLATPLVNIDQVAQSVHEGLKRAPELDFWTLSARSGFNGAAQVRVTAHIASDYAGSQRALAAARDRVRRELQGIPGYGVRISEPADPLSGGGGRFQPIVVSVGGSDIRQLTEEASRLRNIIAATPGISDVNPFQDDGLPEVQLRVNRARAAHYGVTAEDVARSLSVLIQGSTTNQVTFAEDALAIRVRAQGATIVNPRDLLLENVHIRSATNSKGALIPLMNVVDLVAAAGPTVINRENRIRSIRIGARTPPGQALGPVINRLEQTLAQTPLAPGISVQVTGQNEQMNELFGNIVLALGLGSLFVYMVLASLFESLLLPIVVMAAIPLAAIGAVAGLFAFGLPLDLYGGIGIVLLAGIVAKNSILLVDFAIARVRQGQSPREAVLESAPLRLRPILMTSIAMGAGMLPIALGIGAGGSARQALGVATIGGVISSTILTLLVVPSFYLLIEKLSRKKS